MTTKSRNIILISFIAFITLVIALSLVFADEIRQQNKEPIQEANGGYLFTFNIECVDTQGHLLKTDTMTGNGTDWSFAPPKIDGYQTTCKSIGMRDITDWNYPPSNYDREATGSYIVVYTPTK